jgi:hypothetical protein
VNASDRARLREHFLRGFEELQVRDLELSDANDVRMGTFVQCAAFIDALALANSAGLENPGDPAAKWRRFVERYFPDEYAPVAAAYKGFRCLLLHNFSAAPTLGFTHDEPWRHLRREEGGRVILDRHLFVCAVINAFKEFRREVLDDDVLAERVGRWFDLYPPVSFWVPPTPPVITGAMPGTQALSGTGWTGTSYGRSETTAPGVGSPQRSADRPRSKPKVATSIKAKPKRSRKRRPK